MIEISGQEFLTALEASKMFEVKKTYICRLARQNKLRHIRTTLGYLFPVETIEKDWEERLKKVTQ